MNNLKILGQKSEQFQTNSSTSFVMCNLPFQSDYHIPCWQNAISHTSTSLGQQLKEKLGSGSSACLSAVKTRSPLISH